MTTSSERSLHITAFTALVTGTLNIQARYSTSTAFDRPIHFSVATLVLTGLVFFGFAKGYGHQAFGSRQKRHHDAPALLDNLKSWLRSGSRTSALANLVVPVVIRVLLHWRITRTIQCSWDGLYAFLPFFVAIYDHPYLRPIHLPRHAATDNDDTSHRVPVFRFAVLALLWGFAITDLSLLAERTTGVICPTGWYIERLIPLAQLSAVFFDAVIICQVARLRQASQDQAGGAWHRLGILVWSSAAILSFLALWAGLDPVNSTTNLFLTSLELRDVVLDSFMATFALVFGVCLLGSFQPNIISLVVTATTVVVLILSSLFDSTTNVIWISSRGFFTGFVVFLGFGALFHLCRTNSSLGMSLQWEHAVALGRLCIYALATFSLVLFPAFFMRMQDHLDFSPWQAMAAGRIESDAWLANAMKSTSLQSAVAEYRRRHGLPPPPNFDKWYEFALSVNSSIIDTFDQINSDLLPFWAIPPALLREKTAHLLEHPSLSMGGLLIQDGRTSVSPHVHGTHRWMVDAVEEMVKPFSQWLPDMQLAFNLDDECRVAVPVADMTRFVDEAQIARSRLQSKQNLLSFSPAQTPPWNRDFLDADKSIWGRQSDSFQDWSKSRIFSRLIAPTCPADAPANGIRWWNRRAWCRACASAHMENGFVRNWTLAADLCHQPDLAHLHGFLTSPAAMAASQALFPIFSQSRVHNFADILYPSPWSFNEKARYEEEKDVPWAHKLNSVYWRGASSDGFAVHGSWQMFLRARFVHLASAVRGVARERQVFRNFMRRWTGFPAHATASTKTLGLVSRDHTASNGPIAINVSFVGSFSRCDERDCAAQHVTFYGSASAEPPAAHDFEEGWRHRHLIDLDGAAFSGRFLPFVRSGSLPYRAALFRTWWEERIHPWKHYVPLDLRLGDFWPAVNYFGGVGTAHAREMAEAGQQWAQKALRKEDMQVYMFRLLLEWGRLIDDRREDLGFLANQ
ncbi:hypothetical protein NUW58_g4424 [Xylaria curta]|uniref:Uncharacterized protein n=1 Tax=Xylaria curta TaxID=42375 RepID=A0ACC1P6X3_9PEZI|nr:hypothetical protein NUW58_g4424 [Xylaria curta]